MHTAPDVHTRRCYYCSLQLLNACLSTQWAELVASEAVVAETLESLTEWVVLIVAEGEAMTAAGMKY